MVRYKLERVLVGWAVVAGLSVMQSCGVLERSCSLRPCPAGLVVEVSGDASSSPLTVEATTPGGVQRSEPCVVQGEFCLARFGPDFTPEQVLIRVLGASDTTSRSVRPHYTISYPNGADCGPVCRSSTVSIAR